MVSRDKLTPLLLVLATLVVYAQVARFDYVSFDDSICVYENEQVMRGLTWDGVVWAFTTIHYDYYRPLC